MSANLGYNLSNFCQSVKSQADYDLLINQIPSGGSITGRFRFDAGEDVNAFIVILNTLKAANRGIDIIFQASDTLDNLTALNALKQAGYTPKAAEFVNEPFYKAGGYNFDFTLYSPLLTSFCEMVMRTFPGMRVSIPIAPRPKDAVGVMGTSSQHSTWNNAVYKFIDDNPQYLLGVSPHIYFNGNEIPAIGGITTDETGTDQKGTFPVKRVYNYATDTQDETYWQNIYNQADPAKLWTPLLNYIRSRTKVPIYVTEMGIVNSGALNGSWTYAAVIWRTLCAVINEPQVDSICVHAGISASTPGAVCPRKTWDVRDKNNLNNVSSATWDAMSMALMMQGGDIRLSAGDTHLTLEGVYFLPYNSGAALSIIADPGFKIDSQAIYGITGKRYSSLSRNTEATQKGSVLGLNEVTGITVVDSLLPMTFGFVKVVVSKVVILPPPPRRGCTDSKAVNYDPLAVIDDGSCIYPTPPPPPDDTCTKCKSWWYRLFHASACKNCK